MTEILNELALAEDILILTHKNTDGDTIGSAVALCIALRQLGKRAFILDNPDMTERYRTIAEGYFAEDGWEPGYIAAVDISSAALIFEGGKKYLDHIDLAIDHHVIHKNFSKKKLVIPEAAACGEVVHDVIAGLGAGLTKEMADALYISISTDTGCFLFSNTTPKTHETAAKLMAAGADFHGINRRFFVMKSKSKMSIENILISNLSYFEDSKIAAMILTRELIERTGATEDDLDNISSITRIIEGVEIGILARELDAKSSKVSVRTVNYVSASDICAKFDGGGHERAAGFVMNATCEEALMKTIAVIREMKVL